MSVLSSQMDTALRAGENELWLLEVALPDSTRLWSDSTYAVAGEGLYKGKVLRWGPIQRRISDERSGALLNAAFTVDVDDTDREFSSLTQSGANSKAILGSTVTLYLAASGVVKANWYTVYTGRLASWVWSDFVVKLTFRREDDKLISPINVPRLGHVWDNAHGDVIDLPAPLLLGTFNSAPWTNRGFVRCPMVDVTGTKTHLVCLGAAKSVTGVFIDDVQTTGTDPVATASIIEFGGYRWTVITWSTDPGDNIVVTADVQGYEATGDGTGAVITDPAAQLKHLLTQFVFATYKTGDWLTAASPFVNGASITAAATFFAARSYNNSRRIGDVVTPYDLITEWAKSQEARVWWNGAGQIEVGIEDPTLADIYAPTWRPAYTFDANPMVIGASDRGQLDEISFSDTYDDAQGNYKEIARLSNVGVENPVVEDVTRRWGSSS